MFIRPFFCRLNIVFAVHVGLQGTTKPTQYFVVYDEIGFKADELQNFMNAVSYLNTLNE